MDFVWSSPCIGVTLWIPNGGVFWRATLEFSKELSRHFNWPSPDFWKKNYSIILFCFTTEFWKRFPNTVLSKKILENKVLFDPQALLFYKRLIFSNVKYLTTLILTPFYKRVRRFKNGLRDQLSYESD